MKTIRSKLPTALAVLGLVCGLALPFGARAEAQTRSGARSGVQSAPRASQPERSARPVGVQVFAYTFRHKTAAEALALVRPLLSKEGTIELQPESNTLVVRDTLAALGRIVPTLRAFDRPPQPLRVQVMIVRASTQVVSGVPEAKTKTKALPAWLEERLRDLLRWDHYTVLAESGFDTREGQDVSDEVGELYGVSFRLGNVFENERVQLRDFEIWHSGRKEAKPLLRATLNLWLGKPKVLGLANSESSKEALMVVLTCKRAVPTPRYVSPAVPPAGGR
jgi:hypothetical protein